ncbi:hypothetical protein [Gallaecimonas xiamenensis]|uniref:Uncharacterized protein n=1 Tax=Gallaecimonas xiamenensis 3-C-1 TaxID=745411 RepID=K2JUF1_9GAMM|nr:hypothetical protein [Gallaecimonas xiamenensis]EKE74009.1 hypothetical protein B3C1_09328 [Gallaecimonas xiamenensis 3-C-1]
MKSGVLVLILALVIGAVMIFSGGFSADPSKGSDRSREETTSAGPSPSVPTTDDAAWGDKDRGSAPEADADKTGAGLAEAEDAWGDEKAIYKGDTVDMERVSALVGSDTFNDKVQALRDNTQKSEDAMALEQDLYQRFNDALGQHGGIYFADAACNGQFCLASINFGSKDALEGYLQSTVQADSFPFQYSAQQEVTTDSGQELHLLFMKTPPRFTVNHASIGQ